MSSVGTPQKPSTAALLGVDHQGSPAPGQTPVDVNVGPGYSDEWFDVASERMVKA